MLPIQQNPPLLAVPLQQVPLQVATAEEEIVSSRLSLDKEIDRFHFDEEEGVPERPMQVLDSETEFDRLSAARPLKLIVTQVTNSSEEEEEGMDLKQRTGLKGVKGSFYISFSKKEVGPGAPQNGLQSTILLLPGCA